MTAGLSAPETRLAACIRGFLDQDAYLEFRSNYQQFRRGKAFGAHGETSYVARSNTASFGSGQGDRPLPDAILTKPGQGNSMRNRSKSVIDDDDDDELKSTQFIRDLDTFRQGYRSFRRGFGKGANTDLLKLAANITRDHLQLLPAMQSHQLMEAIPQRSILDEGVPDVKTKRFQPTQFHIHFGCGKLGLGLVLPAMLSSGKNFALLDNRCESWHSVIDSPVTEALEISINGVDVAALRVVRETQCDDALFQEISRAISASDNVEVISNRSPLQLFICVKNEAVNAKFCRLATTFSSSVGPGLIELGELLGGCIPVKGATEKQPTFFGCENDHEALDELQLTLHNKVDVVHCMVDRICTERSINENKIMVCTEPDPGEIVVMTPHTFPSYAPAFGGANFHLPLFEAEAEYLANRKITIVNGLHTTLAFMTLCLKEAEKSCEAANHPLLTTATLSEEKQKEVFGWAVARLLMILYQHDIGVIKYTHKRTSDEEVIDLLLAYSKRTLKRFTTTEDTTARVLSGGVANRWRTRLRHVDEFLMIYEVEEIPLGRLLLKKAGLTYSYLLKNIRRLTEDSFRFTGLDIMRKNHD